MTSDITPEDRRLLLWILSSRSAKAAERLLKMEPAYVRYIGEGGFAPGHIRYAVKKQLLRWREKKKVPEAIVRLIVARGGER